jgi:hypothetical protein
VNTVRILVILAMFSLPVTPHGGDRAPDGDSHEAGCCCGCIGKCPCGCQAVLRGAERTDALEGETANICGCDSVPLVMPDPPAGLRLSFESTARIACVVSAIAPLAGRVFAVVVRSHDSPILSFFSVTILLL